LNVGKEWGGWGSLEHMKVGKMNMTYDMVQLGFNLRVVDKHKEMVKNRKYFSIRLEIMSLMIKCLCFEDSDTY
jgi:hypothetical protein